MMTVKEVSRLTGVSIRALQYYDRIGLFHPSGHTEAGYRLYDEADLETLQQILLFRELEFPLKDIRKIIRSPGFDRSKALDQQIGLLKLKKEHIENLIDLAERIKETEVGTLSFDAFDTGKLEKYAAQAKASWGATPAYQEYEKKSKNRTEEEKSCRNISQSTTIPAQKRSCPGLERCTLPAVNSPGTSIAVAEKAQLPSPIRQSRFSAGKGLRRPDGLYALGLHRSCFRVHR